jgi:putative intracellular protease/amidase
VIKFFETSQKFVAVICASTLAIHAAGAFPGCKATSYPSLRSHVDAFYAYQEQDVVVDGKLITSRGPATAMPFALTILEAVGGKAKRDSVASALLY